MFVTQLAANADTVLDIREKICDPLMLPELLVLPKTSKLSYEEVSDALCVENPELAVNISLELVKRFDVSDMIANVSLHVLHLYLVINNVCDYDITRALCLELARICSFLSFFSIFHLDV